MNGKETPNYPDIKWKDDKRTFYYKIIKAGIFPHESILCQTQRPYSYSISHSYIVQTTWKQNTCTVRYSINYINNKPTYIVEFRNNFSNRVASDKSFSDAIMLYHKVNTNLFLFWINIIILNIIILLILFLIC